MVTNTSKRGYEVNILRLLQHVLFRPQKLGRMLSQQDQELFVEVFTALKQYSDNPHLYKVKLGKTNVVVLHSYEGIQELVNNPAFDKNPTSRIGKAISRNLNVYEWTSGKTDEHGGNYNKYSAKVTEFLGVKQTELRDKVEKNIFQYFEGYGRKRYGLRDFQFLTASLVLSTLFPYHDWTKTEVKRFIERFEKTVDLVGPVLNASLLSGDSDEKLISNKAIAEAFDNHNSLFLELYEEEVGAIQALESKQIIPNLGLMSTLAEVNADWLEILANTVTLVLAAYDTIATSATEFAYQSTKNQSLWYDTRLAIQKPSANRKNFITDLIYEVVRIITPLGLTPRQAEDTTTLMGVEISPDELVMVLLAAPLHDKKFFPQGFNADPPLSDEQRQVIRIAWWPKPTSKGLVNRNCKGFPFSIAAMSLIMEYLTTNFKAPKMVHDGDIGTFGTHKRRNFRFTLEKV